MPELQQGEDFGQGARDSIRISVAYEAESNLPAARIETAVRAAVIDLDYDSIEVSVAIVDDATIHELNRQYLDHDYPTDVLSFTLADDGSSLIGEIVVSVDTAAACAVDAGWSTNDELLLYLVHGALHLAGYHDKQPHDAREMRRQEARVLRAMGVMLSAQDSRWRECEALEDDSR